MNPELFLIFESIRRMSGDLERIVKQNQEQAI